ncbi:hypothetical protein IV487_14870 [Enterococcus saccharolyticus]|uniref:hypothetical protein n=1 Tax=Enterococcus saccharolyticus TaxID=41997 RepID=UPI001E334425|nr:hypothetical protein [Enterococcus saccharolyticus]MCD5003744.1 hypothetical protein [Enterococcus saccharolyticus]
MTLEYWQEKFEEIKNSSLAKYRKAEMYANLMTGLEREFRIKQLSSNDDVDEKVMNLYQTISKARY